MKVSAGKTELPPPAAKKSDWVLLIAVAVSRALASLAIIKVMAWALGPAQFGTVTQLSGLASLFYVFAGGATGNALIARVGANDDAETRARWLSSALHVGVGASLILAALVVVLHAFGGELLFGAIQAQAAFLGIAAVQVVMGFGNIALAYASGAGNLRAFGIASILGSLGWAAATIAATLAFDFQGALWATVAAPAFTAVIALSLLRPSLALARPQLNVFSRERTGTLLRAAAFFGLAASALPVAQSFVRADLGARLGWHDVGLWQAIARLSDAYMQVFGVLMLNLLFPRLLRAREPGTARAVMLRVGAVAIGLFIVGAAVLYPLRELVISLAFSQAFLESARYVAPQLAGDFCKVCAWILLYRLMARDHLVAQPLVEIAQGLCFVGTYLILIGHLGATAPVYAHLVSCSVVFVGLGVAVRMVRWH